MATTIEDRRRNLAGTFELSDLKGQLTASSSKSICVQTDIELGTEVENNETTTEADDYDNTHEDKNGRLDSPFPT